jgi:hypothetical protein
VRRLVALVVVLVFASLISIDGICCPDGCTHEQEASSQQPAQHSGDGGCMLCLGSIDSAAAPALSPSGFVTNRVALPSLRSHLDALATPPDHPPRS